MKGYVIFQEKVFDKEAFEEYKKMSPESIKKYGGEFVVRGGDIEVLEGGFDFERVAMLVFPSVEQARAWYNSQEYAEAKEFRLKISKCQAILVQGT